MTVKTRKPLAFVPLGSPKRDPGQTGTSRLQQNEQPDVVDTVAELQALTRNESSSTNDLQVSEPVVRDKSVPKQVPKLRLGGSRETSNELRVSDRHQQSAENTRAERGTALQ